MYGLDCTGLGMDIQSIKKALRAGNTYELELALKRELLLYKTAAAMNGSMAFTGRKQPSGLKEWQKAWLQEEFDKMKQVRRCSGLFGPDCPGSVLQTWNGGVLGPEGGAAVTLLAMAWLAAWLTWGAARGEKQKDAGDA